MKKLYLLSSVILFFSILKSINITDFEICMTQKCGKFTERSTNCVIENYDICQSEKQILEGYNS